MLNWKNPFKELPKQGETVWVLLQHWKEEGALSCELYAGEVFHHDDGTCYVENLDYIGHGIQRWYLRVGDEGTCYDEALAWLPENELSLPHWAGSKK